MAIARAVSIGSTATARGIARAAPRGKARAIARAIPRSIARAIARATTMAVARAVARAMEQGCRYREDLPPGG